MLKLRVTANVRAVVDAENVHPLLVIQPGEKLGSEYWAYDSRQLFLTSSSNTILSFLN